MLLECILVELAGTIFLRQKYLTLYSRHIKGNVAVYKDLNIEFVTKNSFCHKLLQENAIKL